MDATDLDGAIGRLCERFRWHGPVDVLIVGGAAGMLTGVFPPTRTTGDVDVMLYVPNNAMVALERLADEIGRELDLPANWFNSNVQIRSDALPDGWADRRQLVARGECLTVYAASRPDLLAMKFLAHRPQDMVDVGSMGVTAEDRQFVRAYLARLPEKGTRVAEVTEASDLLEGFPLSKP